MRGFEAAACFYIHDLARVKGKARLDLTIDPPPDLVVEIDITNSLLDKLALFAAMGVPEVWRHNGHRLIFYIREGCGYVAREQSSVLPGVKRAAVAHLIEAGESANGPARLHEVREWVSAQGEGNA